MQTSIKRKYEEQIKRKENYQRQRGTLYNDGSTHPKDIALFFFFLPYWGLNSEPSP
jgi:hypothetical protein